MYNRAKKKCEKLIINSGKNYTILRIPRIYGKSRSKGLIQDLKLNKVPKSDFNKTIEYLDISRFVIQTNNIKVNNSIIHYKYLSKNTIKFIKEMYV